MRKLDESSVLGKEALWIYSRSLSEGKREDVYMIAHLEAYRVCALRVSRTAQGYDSRDELRSSENIIRYIAIFGEHRSIYLGLQHSDLSSE